MAMYAGIISLLDHERTRYQTKRVPNIGNKKIEPPEGEHKELADTRASGVYFATKYSGIARINYSGRDTVLESGDGCGVQGGCVQPIMPRLL